MKKIEFTNEMIEELENLREVYHKYIDELYPESASIRKEDNDFLIYTALITARKFYEETLEGIRGE